MCSRCRSVLKLTTPTTGQKLAIFPSCGVRSNWQSRQQTRDLKPRQAQTGQAATLYGSIIPCMSAPPQLHAAPSMAPTTRQKLRLMQGWQIWQTLLARCKLTLPMLMPHSTTKLTRQQTAILHRLLAAILVSMPRLLPLRVMTREAIVQRSKYTITLILRLTSAATAALGCTA